MPPDEKFGEAAIIADHSGKPNQIADLLQALQREHNIEFSLRNLELMLRGGSIEKRANELLKERLKNRKLAEKLVEEGQIKKLGHTFYVVHKEKLDSAIVSSLLPDAFVVLVFRPHSGSKWIAKVRLGENAPSGLNLHQVMAGLDPNYGGRWNAGNNKRAGGTDIPPQKYAEMVNRSVIKLVDKK